MTQVDSRLANRILLGLIIGALAGIAMLVIGAYAPTALALARWFSTAVLDPFGQVFLRLLFFVVIPLIFASLALGIVQLGKLGELGPLAGRTFAMFALNMIVAVALGLLVMNVLDPGGRLDPATQVELAELYGGAAQGYAEAQANSPPLNLTTLVQMFMPRNLFGAFVGNNRDALGEVLPLILFAILVGAAGTQLAASRRAQLRDGLETVTELMTRIVHYALRLAPYAVPAMIFSVIVKIGFGILVALGVFVLGCVFVIALHLFGVLAVWVKLGTRRSPLAFFRQITPVLVTAFTTSSSNATLPTSLATARETLGVRASTAGFVLPLGATMNMSGTALYEGCVVLFVAQVFGVDLSLGQQVTLLFLAVLSAVAVAGIPGGSLPLIAGLLVTFGVPPEGIGIVLGVDRLLDMARTTLNVGADLVTCAIVDEKVPASAAAEATAPGSQAG
ncbi:MAG: dicarboxylate/amino acid:cation symporter [Steroidobacteraceae bacterium]